MQRPVFGRCCRLKLYKPFLALLREASLRIFIDVCVLCGVFLVSLEFKFDCDLKVPLPPCHVPLNNSLP